MLVASSTTDAVANSVKAHNTRVGYLSSEDFSTEGYMWGSSDVEEIRRWIVGPSKGCCRTMQIISRTSLTWFKEHISELR